MKLVLNLPADLEAILTKLADQAGLDIHEYVSHASQLGVGSSFRTSISHEQFEGSLKRLHEIHANVPAQFDDNRESIYERPRE